MPNSRSDHLPANQGAALKRPLKAYRVLKIGVWKEDWKTVAKAAKQAIAAGTKVAKADTKAGYAAKQARHEKRVDGLAEFLQLLTKSKSGRAYLAQIEKKLRSKGGKHNPFAADVGKLARGKARKASALASIDSLRRLDFRREAGHGAVGAICKGLQAIVFSDFNQAFLKASGVAGKPNLVDLNRLSATTLRGLRTLQKAIQQARTETARTAACTKLINACRAMAPALAKAQGVAVAALWRTLNAKGGKPSRFTAPLLTASDVTRELLASHSAALRMIYQLDSPDGKRDAALVVLNSGKRVAFAPRARFGKAVGPKRLLQSGGSSKPIVLEGVVAAVTAGRNTARELIGRMTVREANGRETVNAVIKYTHLGHIGVTVGGVVRLIGVFKRASSMAGGRPAVEIDRLSLADESASSWHTAFMQSGDAYFRRFPNGVAMQWSIGPQLRARGKWKTNYYGAGEVLWGPLVATRGKQY